MTRNNEIRKYLKHGALGIGEQKFQVDSDSVFMQRIADVAAEFKCQCSCTSNTTATTRAFRAFTKCLEKYPRVNFNRPRANVLGKHRQEPPTSGALSENASDAGRSHGQVAERLSEHVRRHVGRFRPKCFTRDEDHMRDFLARHQDKLMFGTDCDDKVGAGSKCQGAQILAAIRKLAPSKAIERKILHDNAKKLIQLPAFA